MSDFEQLPQIAMDSDAVRSVDGRICEIIDVYTKSLQNDDRAAFKRVAHFSDKIDTICLATAAEAEQRITSYELKSLQVISMLSRTALSASHNEARDFMMPTGGDWDYWREVDRRTYGKLREIVVTGSGVLIDDYDGIAATPRLAICRFDDHVIERTTNPVALLTSYTARPSSL